MKRKRDGDGGLSSRTILFLIHAEWWGEVMERIKTELGKKELRTDSNELGELPLLQACFKGAPFDLIEAMLEEYPAAAKVKGHGGRLPLHVACVRASPRVLRLLLEAYPEGVKTADIDGRLPVHCLCKGDEVSLETYKMIIDAHPEGVKATDNEGGLPLHCAAYSDIRLEVLKILIDAHPEGASTRDSEGYLPLHCFAEFRSWDNSAGTRKRVQALLEPILNNEEACKVFDREGRTPLCIAAEFDALNLHTCVSIERCPPNVIITVARRYPRQLCVMDEGGNFPLHVTAANRNLNGAQALFRGLRLEENANDSDDSDDDDDEASGDENEVEHQDASNDEDGAGDDAEVSEDLIGALVKLYPGAAAVANRDQKFPLILAIESGKRWDEGVEAIADAAKHVSLIKDESANLYPFMLAATVDTPCLTTVYKLLRHCPELKRYIID